MGNEFGLEKRTNDRGPERIEAVKAKFPSERLLVHSAADGWEPLCRFLSVPVPEHDYPWVNEGRQIRRVVPY